VTIWDETGGRYVHLIADGGISTSGDIAKAIGCGADAVMLGEPLSLAEGAPAGGAWWHSSASHPTLPRGGFCIAGEPRRHAGGAAVRPGRPARRPAQPVRRPARAMAKCGYRDVKEFQKVALGPRHSDRWRMRRAVSGCCALLGGCSRPSGAAARPLFARRRGRG
jgi:IMP dehydrogenase